MPTIKLTQGKEATIDEADQGLASYFKWHYARVSKKCYSEVGYAATAIRKEGKTTRLYLHHLVLPLRGKKMVDHINGDTLDCRRANLRLVTKGQNQMNSKKRRHSRQPFKGVYLNERATRTPSWVARITAKGRKRHIGTYLTARSAALAYDDAARKLHGEFARLNFPS